MMLTHLNIKNFITIKEADLDFNEGLTVFTGESGSGKSVIFSALYCLLGKSFPESYIRTGSKVAECEAIFNIKDYQDPFLESFSDDKETLIIFRQQSLGKPQRIMVNSRSVTQKTLKTIGSHLAIIVSQHEQLSLLNSQYQLALLDQLNPTISTLINQYKHVYSTYLSQKKELDEFEKNVADDSQLEFYKFQFDDIHQHHFDPSEDQVLIAQKKAYSATENQKKYFYDINNSINTGLSSLEHVSSLLKQCDDANLITTYEALQSTIHELSDISFTLSQHHQTLQQGQTISLSDIESRLDLIFSYTSKYKQLSLQQLCEFRDSLETKIKQSNQASLIRCELTSKLADTAKSLKKSARLINTERLLASDTLKQLIVPNLKELGFEHVEFDVSFSELSDFASTGIDTVDFMIKINPGETIKPLANIASGGELSRILLAIFSLFANVQKKQLYLFDEIDTGIGGIVANAMGLQLKNIAHHQQILCITHLAQIAACANHHIVISKLALENETITKAVYLNSEEKAPELKRMVGGESVIQSLAEVQIN